MSGVDVLGSFHMKQSQSTDPYHLMSFIVFPPTCISGLKVLCLQKHQCQGRARLDICDHSIPHLPIDQASAEEKPWRVKQPGA